MLSALATVGWMMKTSRPRALRSMRHEDLAVGEVMDGDPVAGCAERVGDLAGQGAVCSSREEEEGTANGGNLP